jgi:hypothetical protein
MGYDRSELGNFTTQEIRLREIPSWRQRMVERERIRKETIEDLKKKNPANFLSDSSFRISRKF